MKVIDAKQKQGQLFKRSLMNETTVDRAGRLDGAVEAHVKQDRTFTWQLVD